VTGSYISEDPNAAGRGRPKEEVGAGEARAGGTRCVFGGSTEVINCSSKDNVQSHTCKKAVKHVSNKNRMTDLQTAREQEEETNKDSPADRKKGESRKCTNKRHGKNRNQNNRNGSKHLSNHNNRESIKPAN